MSVNRIEAAIRRSNPRYLPTDVDIALKFLMAYQNDVRYDHALDCWFIWNGHYWQKDVDGKIHRMCIALSEALIVGGDELAGYARKRLTSADSRATVLKTIRVCTPIADDGRGWNEKPHLLACRNGVVDLRTGKLSAGDREDKLSLAVPWNYDPEAKAPRWERFIAEIMDDNEELIGFLRAMLGYCATGETREQCFFILYGSGSNGKSLLRETLRYVLGKDFVHSTVFRVFTTQGSLCHPEVLAEMHNRRIVTAVETTERGTFDEGMIKPIAHGDDISARYMYGNRFSFTPQCKLLFCVNHRPRVLDDSFGFWRSARLIPFNRTFSPDAEPTLKDTLMSEAEGILAWLVQAARDWYECGLPKYQVIEEAAQEWKEENDPLLEFIQARCTEGDGLSCPSSDLYIAYQNWCESQGIREHQRISRDVFCKRLARRYRRARFGNSRTRHFLGIDLNDRQTSSTFVG